MSAFVAFVIIIPFMGDLWQSVFGLVTVIEVYAAKAGCSRCGLSNTLKK